MKTAPAPFPKFYSFWETANALKFNYLGRHKFRSESATMWRRENLFLVEMFGDMHCCSAFDCFGSGLTVLSTEAGQDLK